MIFKVDTSLRRYSTLEDAGFILALLQALYAVDKSSLNHEQWPALFHWRGRRTGLLSKCTSPSYFSAWNSRIGAISLGYFPQTSFRKLHKLMGRIVKIIHPSFFYSDSFSTWIQFKACLAKKLMSLSWAKREHFGAGVFGKSWHFLGCLWGLMGLLCQRKECKARGRGGDTRGQCCDSDAKHDPDREGEGVGTQTQCIVQDSSWDTYWCVCFEQGQPCLVMTQQVRGGKGSSRGRRTQNLEEAVVGTRLAVALTLGKPRNLFRCGTSCL